MTDPKSILDTVADEANKLFEHAALQVRTGSFTAARETMSIAEGMSNHAREIEDHELRNGDVGMVSKINIEARDIAKAIRDDQARA